MPLARHRRVAEKMLADLVNAAERGAVGLPAADLGRARLSDLLAGFEADMLLGLASKARAATRKPSAAQAKLTTQRVRDLLDGCRFVTVADLNDAAPAAAARYLNGTRPVTLLMAPPLQFTVGVRRVARRGGLPMTPSNTPSTVLLKHHLKALRLPTVASECEKFATRWASENVAHLGYLLQVCELELTERERKAAERRLRADLFPGPKTLAEFDFTARPRARTEPKSYSDDGRDRYTALMHTNSASDSRYSESAAPGSVMRSNVARRGTDRCGQANDRKYSKWWVRNAVVGWSNGAARSNG